MYSPDKRNSTLGLGLTTAMAAVLLTGCAGNAAPSANVSAAQAQAAIANGEATAAIQSAEAAVAADPRNAAYRMTLGNAYLEAGRFASASTSFEDAMALGENSPRAALSLALALTGQARYREAAGVLNEWETAIAVSDLGLAFALAGEPERGVHILTNAIRGGDNTVKSRQNLAYAYAVAGRWREARMMVAQDVPAHEVGARMEEWAQLSGPHAYSARVASLLGVPANARDNGQPVHLALVNSPSASQLAFEAAAPAAAPAMDSETGELAALDDAPMSVPATTSELPSVGSPAPQGGSFASAFGGTSSPLAVREPDARYASEAVVQTVPGSAPSAFAPPPAAAPTAAPRIPAIAQPALVPSRPAAEERAAAPAPRAAAPRAAAPAVAAAPAPIDDPTHLVQLGSFSSEAGAQRAWNIYVSRYPELADREMVITQAVVRGRNYWRVSAGGFDRSTSRAMCSRVDAANGDGCISWAASSPLPGAIDNGIRLARR
ncbi:SPOR domain-containing protein [Aurantiacibacter sediminis]|uniref:Tetratricopeptide repeat protein n=1 Tax=Aurantiacibacter sediminis TaxID=2793064 RepID=A0ABS0N6P7_9SPHN|nr:SPOR domain-containing protein [Aurantiacibacter sediminis]MBH5323427.1 tetratricopeptide repeat protein [Aurantiacibacter sediminis]